MAFLVFQISDAEGFIIDESLQTLFDAKKDHWKQIGEEGTLEASIELLQASKLDLQRLVDMGREQVTYDEAAFFIRCRAMMSGVDPEAGVKRFFDSLTDKDLIPFQ